MENQIFKGDFVFNEGKLEDYTIETNHLGLLLAIVDIHKMILEEFQGSDDLVEIFGKIDNVIKYILENHGSILEGKFISVKDTKEFTLEEMVVNDEENSKVSHNYSTEGNLSSEELFVVMSLLLDSLKEEKLFEEEDLSFIVGVLRGFEESYENNI